MKKILFLLLVSFFSCGKLHETVKEGTDPAITAEATASLPSEEASEHPLTSDIPPDSPLDTTSPTKDIATQLNGLTMPAAACDMIYFNQNDTRWAEKNYGPQNRIGTYGCGPTVLSMLVSTFTDRIVLPDEMASWCYQNNFFSQNSGSYHSIIAQGAAAWGLDVKPMQTVSYRAWLDELYGGRLIVVLLGPGHFTGSGHFLIIRNVTLEGKLLIADPNSLDNSRIPWSYELIQQELKSGTVSVWSIGK